MTKKQHNEKLKAPDLLDEECTEKFKIMIREKYRITDAADEGATVVFHIKIDVDEVPVTLKFYTNGTLHLSASPKLDQTGFSSVFESIKTCVKQCTESIHDRRPVSTIRAREVFDFASGLDIEKSDERMVTIVLCDTANEIILTEIMKDKKISGPALNEGVRKKISYLEKKDVIIPFSKELSNIREVRNKAVHDGQIPSEGQVATSMKTTKQFIETM